jgi:hypothetical protein
MKKRPTKVVFRKFKRGGDIIALFTQELGTNDSSTCQCYQHVGQHGHMDLRHRHMLVTATPSEYAGLKAELESLGYSLIVYMNISPRDARIRRNKIAMK